MKILLTKSNNAQENLALEETILKDQTIKEDILMVYINKNCIVIGRNQNIWEEINHEYVKENHINLVRRISGGGAVYQDINNICFSFITNLSKSYNEFLTPIIEFFKSLGLNAKFHGKNDVHINDFKVSGNAQYKHENRMFHHGTILFNTDMSKLTKALKPNQLKMESKGIKSIRQRVSNIYDLLDEKMTTKHFVSQMLKFFKDKYNAETLDTSCYQNKKLKALTQLRSSDEWIYNKNPEFEITSHKHFLGGTIKLSLNTKDNKITIINFLGDFLSTIDFEEIYKLFVGQTYNQKTIINIIHNVSNFNDYFGKIKKEEIISLFF